MTIAEGSQNMTDTSTIARDDATPDVKQMSADDAVAYGLLMDHFRRAREAGHSVSEAWRMAHERYIDVMHLTGAVATGFRVSRT